MVANDDENATRLLRQAVEAYKRMDGTNLRLEYCRRAIVRLLEYLDRIE